MPLLTSSSRRTSSILSYVAGSLASRLLPLALAVTVRLVVDGPATTTGPRRGVAAAARIAVRIDALRLYADPRGSGPRVVESGRNSDNYKPPRTIDSYIVKTQISVSFLAYRQSGPLGCHITYQLGESICVGVSSAFFRSFAESIHRAGGPCFQRPASLSAVEQPAPVVVVSVDASSFESVHWDPRSSRNLNTTHRGSLSKTVEARVSPRHFWTRGIWGINYARGVGWCALARSRLVVIHGFWLPSRNGSHQEERCDSTAGGRLCPKLQR